MYSHSLQSYIWNRVVSERIKEMGLELREGEVRVSSRRGRMKRRFVKRKGWVYRKRKRSKICRVRRRQISNSSSRLR